MKEQQEWDMKEQQGWGTKEEAGTRAWRMGRPGVVSTWGVDTTQTTTTPSLRPRSPGGHTHFT